MVLGLVVAVKGTEPPYLWAFEGPETSFLGGGRVSELTRFQMYTNAKRILNFRVIRISDMSYTEYG